MSRKKVSRPGRTTSRTKPAAAKKSLRRLGLKPAEDPLAAILFPCRKSAEKQRRFGVFLAIADLHDGTPAVRCARHEIAAVRATKPSKATLKAKPECHDQAAQLLAGLAHRDRLRIAHTALDGACTHKDLEQATGLKAGPLYHHIRSLERAGLLETVARNTYGLTEIGRLSFLVLTAVIGTAAKGKRGWQRLRVGGS